MTITLYYTDILTPYEWIERGTIVLSDDGKILYAGTMEEAPDEPGTKIDLRGRITIPGLIDVHVHGGHGVNFGEHPGQAADELCRYSQWVAKAGVTGYLTSLAAPDAQSLVALVTDYVKVMETGVEGAEPLGIHLEGPYLNPARKGAFTPSWLRTPSLDEVKAFLEAGKGWVRQMTLAPELPNAQEVAAYLRSHGVVASLGHSDTNWETASAALQSNFTHVTHTYNAQRGLTQREPGVLGAVMASDYATAELIGDGYHVHPAAMKALVRCLGTDRVVLITDAMSGAGLPDGEYELIGQKVFVRNGMANLENGTIAGSTAVMNQCVRVASQQAGVPLMEAVKMGSLNPARAMGFAGRLGSILPGKDASLAVIDSDANVYMTIVNGKIVYQNL